MSGLNRKITQNKSLLVENELNTLKNEIRDVSSLVKKQIITLESVKLMVSNLDVKIDENMIDIVKVMALLSA